MVNILQHFSEVITWMLSIGRPAHPGPRRPPSGTFCIEFLTVGVGCPTEILPWSASLITSRLRNIDVSLPGLGLPPAVSSLKKSLRCGLQPARSPLLEDMLESGLLVSAKPLLCFPHFAHLVFKEAYSKGRALRGIIPFADGRIAHLFVWSMVIRGTETDPISSPSRMSSWRQCWRRLRSAGLVILMRTTWLSPLPPRL